MTLADAKAVIENIHFLNWRFIIAQDYEGDQYKIFMSQWVRDSEGSSEVVKTGQMTVMSGVPSADFLLDIVRKMIISRLTHEADELLVYGDKRPFHPHRPGSDAPVLCRQLFPEVPARW